MISGKDTDLIAASRHAGGVARTCEERVKRARAPADFTDNMLGLLIRGLSASKREILVVEDVNSMGRKNDEKQMLKSDCE